MFQPQPNFLSLGAGVQSTVVAFMSAHNELPPITAAIFADTGWEPNAVYKHLEWMESQLPFPVHRVTIGHNLQDRVRENRNHSGSTGYIDIPKFHLNSDGSHSFNSRRQCTTKYKIRPIRRKIRQLIGYPGRANIPHGLRVKQTFGISLDEHIRMRDSDTAYIENVYPLIDVGMDRNDCMSWWEKHYPEQPLAKSACVGCPFHSAREWVHLANSEPAQFEEACRIDEAIRHCAPPDATAFLHSRRLPLRQAIELDIEKIQVDDDKNEKSERLQQLADSQLALWDNECSGHCGV